jgi:thioredoxin 1
MNTLPPSRELRVLNARTFDNATRHGVVLVDFSEPWCTQCHLQVPILERVARRVGDRAAVALVDVDEDPDLAAHFHVETIPTLLLFDEGQVVRTFAGVQSETVLTRAVLDLAAAGRRPDDHQPEPAG